MMKKYNFDEIIDRKGTDCIKYDALQHFFGTEDLLPLWVADTDFRVPQFITDAIEKRASNPIYAYTFMSDRFYNSAINWVSRRSGWNIQREWIKFSPGVVGGLATAMNALTNEGDGVLIQTPVYTPFSTITTNNKRKLHTNRLINRDGRYEIDFEDFEAKIKECKLFILCNPHNPVGRVFSREELHKMGEICLKYDVKIISDEIHSDIVFTPHKHTHIAAISEELAQQTVTLIAPSKTFNIAGLSTALAIIPNKDIKREYSDILTRFHIETPNIFGIEALTAGYEQGDIWVDELCYYLKDNFNFVVNYINKNMPRLKVTPSEATFLVWIDFNDLNLSEDKITKSLLHDARIALNKGSDYGDVGSNFMRLNIGAPRSIIAEALKKMQISYDILTN